MPITLWGKTFSLKANLAFPNEASCCSSGAIHFVHPFVLLHIHLSIHLVHPFFHPSIHLSIPPSIHSTIQPSFHHTPTPDAQPLISEVSPTLAAVSCRFSSSPVSPEPSGPRRRWLPMRPALWLCCRQHQGQRSGCGRSGTAPLPLGLPAGL